MKVAHCLNERIGGIWKGKGRKWKAYRDRHLDGIDTMQQRNQQRRHQRCLPDSVDSLRRTSWRFATVSAEVQGYEDVKAWRGKRTTLKLREREREHAPTIGSFISATNFHATG